MFASGIAEVPSCGLHEVISGHWQLMRARRSDREQPRMMANTMAAGFGAVGEHEPR